MSVLRFLTRSSIEDPTLPLTSTALYEWLSGGTASTAGVTVSEKRVFGLTAFYRGVFIMAGVIAGLPLKVYRKDTRERIARPTVLDNPNPIQTPFEFWQTMIANAIPWGNAYALKLRDGSGEVRQLWPIHPCRVYVEMGFAGNGWEPERRYWIVDRDGQRRAFSSFDVFHVMGLSLDGYQGISPLQLSRESLGVSIAAEQSAARFYANGSQLAGTLETDQKLDALQAVRLQVRWDDRHSGASNAGRIAVLDAGARFKPISIPPADAQLLQSREYTVEEIGRLTGVLSWMLNDPSKSTSWGTGIEQQNIGWINTSLGFWIDSIEQRIIKDLLPFKKFPGDLEYSEFSVEGLLRGDAATRAAFYAQMVQWGIYNRNEVRVKENLEPVEGLDEFLTPSNMTLLSIDGKIIPLGGTNAGGGNAD